MFVERFLKQATYHKIILLSNCWEILNCNRISDNIKLGVHKSTSAAKELH